MLSNGLTEEEQVAVREFASHLRDRFPKQIQAVKLYGSKARGESHGESDVDLLLLVTERTGDLDEATIDIVCDILNTHGVFLETVTMTKADYEQARQQQYPFALNIEHDAIAV